MLIAWGMTKDDFFLGNLWNWLFFGEIDIFSCSGCDQSSQNKNFPDIVGILKLNLFLGKFLW
jgi:hypothetical protein